MKRKRWFRATPLHTWVPPLALAALAIGAVMGLHAVAQSARSAASDPGSTHADVMSGYVEAVREAVYSGTGATNLTAAELSGLMNESIKTNLAAQLWFRQAMSGRASSYGAEMAKELRVLESLRAGHTALAIRELEDSLDSDIILLSNQLRLADETKTFKPTAGPRKSLQWAREYRRKFPYRSANPGTDEQVKQGLSYLDPK